MPRIQLLHCICTGHTHTLQWPRLSNGWMNIDVFVVHLKTRRELLADTVRHWHWQRRSSLTASLESGNNSSNNTLETLPFSLIIWVSFPLLVIVVASSSAAAWDLLFSCLMVVVHLSLSPVQFRRGVLPFWLVIFLPSETHSHSVTQTDRHSESNRSWRQTNMHSSRPLNGGLASSTAVMRASLTVAAFAQYVWGEWRPSVEAPPPPSSLGRFRPRKVASQTELVSWTDS